MTPAEFRRHGRAVVDWIADYYERIESFPILSQVEPGDIRSLLPARPPEVGEAFDSILTDLEEVILPGITHWQSPNFFAYFPANASGPAILGDLLSSGLGVQGMLWSTSPACTELETHVLDWLVEMIGLPEKFLSSGLGGGVIQDTASSAVLCALLAARERAIHAASAHEKWNGKLAVYTSAQAHSSIEKAVKISGMRSKNLRLIEVDGNFAMRPKLCCGKLRPIARLVGRLASRAQRSALPLPMQWIPFEKSAAFAAKIKFGSMWTLLCRARPRCVRNFAGFRMESNSQTAIASILTNGCLRISTAVAFTWPTAPH